MRRLRIIVRNTHFRVELKDIKLRSVCKTVNETLITYTGIWDHKTKRLRFVKDKEFYLKYSNDVYQYPINLLTEFVRLLGQHNVQRGSISIQYDREYVTSDMNIMVREVYKDRAHQVGYIDALVARDANPIQLVDLKTGEGKTYISMRAVTTINMVTALVILPKYISKWIDDIMELTETTREQIYIVQGVDSLLSLLEEPEHQFKFIIFSATTLSLYCKKSLLTPWIYPVLPDKLLEVLGIGIVLNDEAHQSFHMVFMILLQVNPKKVIGLSATLDHKDKDIKRMYGVLYPKASKISNLAVFEPYPHVIAVRYRIDNPAAAKCMGPMGYSHMLFEQNIMKNSLLLKGYRAMIGSYVKRVYITDRVPGDKLLIFAGTIRMCTLLTNYFKSLYPELDVRRYVEDDPYENIITADISVSTNQSASTAIDIPGLCRVIQTVSIGSLQSNRQALGRLRKIPGKDVKYYYTYCPDIPSHIKLHRSRKESISGLAKTYTTEQYDNELKSR